MNYQELEQKFKLLYGYATEHQEAELRFVDNNGDSLIASFDTAYETDNGFEPDENGYEEFWAMAFCEKSTQKLFEITYHNIPAEVWDGDQRVI